MSTIQIVVQDHLKIYKSSSVFLISAKVWFQADDAEGTWVLVEEGTWTETSGIDTSTINWIGNVSISFSLSLSQRHNFSSWECSTSKVNA